MKKLQLLLMFIATTTLPVVGSAQDAGQVVDRAMEAMGGKEVLEAVNTMKLTFSGTFNSAPQMQLKVYYHKPANFRYEWIASRGNRIEGTDGKDFWSNSSQQTRDMADEEKEEFVVTAEILTGSFLTDLAGRGVSVTYVGRQNIDGIDSHVLAFNAVGRRTLQWAFGVDDGLPHWMKRVDPNGETVLKISDFKEVAGMLLARKIEILRNDESVIQLGVDVVEINIPIDEALFTRPK